MTPHIRPATTTDLDALAPLFDAYRRFYEQPSDIEMARNFLSARLSRSESVVLVAQRPDGALAGFCQLYPSFCSVLAQPIYTLYDLFVPPAHRQQGVAKALLAAAAERGRRDDMARLDLTTAHTNHAAQALYEGMGWVQDRVFRTYNLDLGPTAAPPPCA
jgi:ribosomal protein S18 acetylase RimI-like enzyme